ncbi:MAG: metal ABC transporter solute-binding protein, Zn/Mn family [Anaerococcus sp.]
MNKKYLTILLSATVLFAGCSQKNTNENVNEQTSVVVSEEANDQNQKEERKLVYTSFYPIYDITKQIVGDKMDVQNLGSLETEAHDWEASAKDLANLNNAELLIINGAGMESWKDNVSESSNVEILDTTVGGDLIRVDDEEEYNKESEDYHNYEEFDPHTWLSPIMGKDQAKVIANKLSEIDPENKDYYQENYEKLAKELDDIINEYKDKFNSKEDNEFVVPHEAFGYLCRDFNLEQIPLTGITSTEEPDAKTMQEVTDKIKEENIHTIFYEKGGSDKASKAIANEINGEIKPLSTLEFVSKEDLEKEVHYQDLIRENLESILKSLEK